MKKSLFLIRLIISLSILGIIIHSVGIKKILVTLTSINPLVFLIAFPLYLIVISMGAFNIYLLLKELNKNIFIKDILKYTFISWSLGLYAPGKMNEFSLAIFLKKQKMRIGKTTAAVIVDILITIITLGLLGILGITRLISKELISIKIAKDTILITGLTMILLLLAVYFGFITQIGRKIIKKYILKKYSKIFKSFNKSMKTILWQKKKILINFFITFLKFLISSVITLALFSSLGQKGIGLFWVLTMTSLIVLISTIPITINGFGLRETSAVYLYSLINIKPEIVVSVYILHTIIQYTISMVTLLIFSKEIIDVKKSFLNIIRKKY